MKRKIVVWLLVLAVLLTGCGSKETGTKALDRLFEKTPVSMEEGHLFFTGKVTASSAVRRAISYYELETEKNTFYEVEITDDPFGCMPERTVTVGILGNTETFPERIALQKGKEYLFDVTVWVQEEETVFLLPTFYSSLPEREGETLQITEADGLKTIDGSYAAYLDRLKTLAGENSYRPEKILETLKERFRSAVERDAGYFKELEFKKIDGESLKKTNQTASALLAKAEETQKTWEGIRGLLQ